MHYNNAEENISFHLTKVKGAAMKGKEAYRAVLDHNSLSAEETLNELAKEIGLPPLQLAYIGSSVLRGLIAGTLSDGRSRNFENLISTRLDITGTFARIDAPFDNLKHTCRLSFLPGAKASEFKRRKNPVNESKPPRGRFDYITYPGGEKGFVKIGEDILIYGHDLKLTNESNIIYMSYTPKGVEHSFAMAAAGIQHPYPYDSPILENTATLLRLGWPPAWTHESLGDSATVRFHFRDGCRVNCHDSFSRHVEILR